MDRISVIQYLINKYSYNIYLEIGVQRGVSFLPIKCGKKIAVDPMFLISLKDKMRWYYKNFSNCRNSYFETTSDDFFLNQKSFLKELNGLDVVFIDGLHTFKATLQDILNSLNFLNLKGTIIVHDCFPPHKAASIYAENADFARKKGKHLSDWNEEWCGDTWKAIAYMKKKYSDILSVKVLNTDYGLGIIQFKNTEKLDLEIDQELFDSINLYEYEDLIENPGGLIGLEDKLHYKYL